MISGLVILSEPNRLCYPYKESIRSFLPVVDEIVVVLNPYGQNYEVDRQEIFDLSKKVRVIPGLFDLREVGWKSYGVMRTTGYHACKGDVVLMFDADGILHEKDHDNLFRQLDWFTIGKWSDKGRGYWLKRRIYTKTRYWPQYKHSGIYNKRMLGDKMDFYDPSGRGIPNYNHLDDKSKSVQFSIQLFGYEHVWDTKEVIVERVTNYGHMKARYFNEETKTSQEYFCEYRDKLIASLANKGENMGIEEHPEIIQSKLNAINESHFSYNFFK